jgi:thiosulfate reductase cytochrome b subunit
MKSCAMVSIREDVVWRSWTSAAAFSVIFSAPSGANAATSLASEVTVPLPASWTMMLIGLGLGFAFYRLFSI